MMALSVPGGVKDASGEVVPSSVGGGKTASKYMTKIIQGLRSNISDEASVKAIDTLAMMIKVWQKAKGTQSLEILRKCKMSWSVVLHKGAPTQVKKGKKGKPDQTVIRSPAKPSRSPWLSQAERAELGNLYKSKWSGLDTIRDQWVALTAEQQHRQLGTFIKCVKSHYDDLNNVSSSVHAKLGKRKHWIEVICKEDNFKPKAKRDEAETFLLAAHFFKKDLTNFDMKVKKVFAPVTYLPDPEGKQLETWNNCFPEEEDSYRITSANFSLKDDGQAYRLWQIWADMFLPVFSKNVVQIEEAKPIGDKNIYSVLLGLVSKH
jgi:hypothetical protein